MLALLCAAMVIAYVTRNAIAVAESTVRADLGISREQSGWLISAFFFPYALCQIPLAQFARSRGPRQALPLFAVAWSIATGITALATGLGTLIATRILQGVAQAGLIPSSFATVARWMPKTEQAFSGGALSSFMSAGGALGSWITGVLLEELAPHVGPGWNWRLTFLMFALPGVLWALAFWFWFRDEPGSHPAVNAAELELIAKGRSPADSAGGREPTPWAALLSSPAMWWICIQQLFRSSGYMFFTSWFATYLQETRGVSIATSGFLNMLPLLAVVAGGMSGGALSDWALRKTGSPAIARKGMGAACLILCGLLVFWSMSITNTLAAVLVISLGSFFAAADMPCGTAIAMEMSGPHVGTVTATLNMTGNLGAWAFPIVVPLLLKHFGSWDAVLLVFGGCYFAAALFWLLLKTKGSILEQSLCKP